MKSPLIIGFIVILSLIIGAAWSWPSYQAFLVLRGQENQKAQELKMRTSYFNNLETLKEKLQKFQTQLDLLDWALPNDASLPLLYGEIQSIAANSGLVLKSISSSPPSQISASQLQTIELNLDLSGQYSGLKEFIARSLRAPRVLQVQSVSFATPKGGSAFNFQVRVEAYSY